MGCVQSRGSCEADCKSRRGRGAEGDRGARARQRSFGNELEVGIRGRERNSLCLRGWPFDRVSSLRTFERHHLRRSETMTDTLTTSAIGPMGRATERRVTSYAFPFVVVAGLWQLGS